MKRIYLDNNASTPLDPAAREAMLPYLAEHYGNPSSNHSFGERARYGIEQARVQVAALINCGPDRIVFGSGGSEANNGAIATPADVKLSLASTPNASVRVTTPFAGACVSCHDSAPAQAHMKLNGAQILVNRSTLSLTGESCAVCHGAGRDKDPAAVHK